MNAILIAVGIVAVIVGATVGLLSLGALLAARARASASDERAAYWTLAGCIAVTAAGVAGIAWGAS